MRVRIAKKIVKQNPPSEMSVKHNSWWFRYNKAETYINRLYNKWKYKQKRNGKQFLTENEIDELINKIIWTQTNK